MLWKEEGKGLVREARQLVAIWRLGVKLGGVFYCRIRSPEGGASERGREGGAGKPAIQSITFWLSSDDVDRLLHKASGRKN